VPLLLTPPVHWESRLGHRTNAFLQYLEENVKQPSAVGAFVSGLSELTLVILGLAFVVTLFISIMAIRRDHPHHVHTLWYTFYLRYALSLYSSPMLITLQHHRSPAEQFSATCRLLAAFRDTPPFSLCIPRWIRASKY
jgi:hypothetical protein